MLPKIFYGVSNCAGLSYGVAMADLTTIYHNYLTDTATVWLSSISWVEWRIWVSGFHESTKPDELTQVKHNRVHIWSIYCVFFVDWLALRHRGSMFLKSKHFYCMLRNRVLRKIACGLRMIFSNAFCVTRNYAFWSIFLFKVCWVKLPISQFCFRWWPASNKLQPTPQPM